VSEWLLKHLQPLIGATIIRVEAEPSEYADAWPVLYVKLRNGSIKALIIQRDPEGNGPGHVEIEDTRTVTK